MKTIVDHAGQLILHHRYRMPCLLIFKDILALGV